MTRPVAATRRHWALALVCALFLLAAALTLDDYGPSLDMTAQRQIGRAALDYLAGDGDRAFDQLHWAWDRYYGAALEAPLVLLTERILGCVAVVPLPDYPIATIRTGQLSDDGVLWEVEFTPDGQVTVPRAR